MPTPTSPPRRVVLLLEDDDDAREIYALYLRRAGFAVTEASNLAEANRAVSQFVPDIVVCDCRLPDGDGLGLVYKWRRTAPMNRVPVVVVSASHERQDVEAASLVRAAAFVAKPCTGAKLVEHVETALRAAS